MRTRANTVMNVVRRVALAAVLLATGCILSGSPAHDRLYRYQVRIDNNYRDRVVVYWMVAGAPRGVAARVGPYDDKVVRVPRSYRTRTDLTVEVCLGTRTPITRCTIAQGTFTFSDYGSTITVFSSSNLAAMVIG